MKKNSTSLSNEDAKLLAAVGDAGEQLRGSEEVF